MTPTVRTGIQLERPKRTQFAATRWVRGIPVALSPCQGKRAFTLIEILLAIAIFSMVLAAIYSSWTAILRSSKVGLDAAAQAQRTRMALRAITEALSSAELFTGNLKYYAFYADTSGDFASLSFVSRLPVSFPGGGLFGDQAVRRVTFTNEPGMNGQPQLVLRQTPLLEAPESDAKPYSIVLAPSLILFEVEFLDTNRWEWVPDWPFTNRLPKMVRVAVNFGEKHQGQSNPEETSVQTILLSAMAISPELQASPGRMGAMPVPPVGAGRPSIAPGLSPRSSSVRELSSEGGGGDTRNRSVTPKLPSD